MNALDVMRYAQRLSVQVNAQDGDLRLRGKRSAVDHVAPLVKRYKRELVVALGGANQCSSCDYLRRFAQTKAFECWDCTHLLMTRERRTDTRRIWFWRCARDYPISEVGVRGERIVVAPPGCDDFQPWRTSESTSHKEEE
jgi:hypothetical protein